MQPLQARFMLSHVHLPANFTSLSICLLDRRNDTQNSVQPPKEHMPLANAPSMPHWPCCYNRDLCLGPMVRFYVFGYALSSDALLKWADNNQFAPEKDDHNRCYLTWGAIAQRLPEDCRQWALVTTKDGATQNCIVIASNGMPDDMERANDLEKIKAVQEVVDVRTPLKWYVWKG